MALTGLDLPKREVIPLRVDCPSVWLGWYYEAFQVAHSYGILPAP